MQNEAPRRPRNRLDLSGLTFGLLTARERMPKQPGTQGERWLCDCQCGRQTVVRTKDITSNNTRSCGHLTGRPRPSPEVPHRAANVYDEIRATVWSAMRQDVPIPHAEMRAKYKGSLSHGTYYRYVHRAMRAFGSDRE